ncbi:hypothetical protein SAMN05428970_2692 [Agromyces sp. CF514]|uniref:hypothetical protein n=1 Tax=Agromyces sp. CF514 TaxID=1881031 RepID=UPI0008DED5F3|nr:hypothetical protein [Agromyces sp. CF514]SFR82887.1 hypothetical protein SAMN05428970_2692 [Agromyces sp. CF514]
MPHAYPLHVDVDATCLCCGSVQRFRFASASDHVVCPHCRTHGGDEKAVRRDREHVALWRGILEAHDHDARAAASAAADAKTDAAATIARLTAEGEQLRAGALDGSSAAGAAVRDELQGDLVRRAERATELTNRRLDKAMAALWRLQAFHHPDARKPGSCICGRSLTACGESRVLEANRQDMLDWERRNLELLRAGKRHGLPPEHPEVAGG